MSLTVTFPIEASVYDLHHNVNLLKDRQTLKTVLFFLGVQQTLCVIFLTFMQALVENNMELKVYLSKFPTLQFLF